jgi:acyl-CoA synthetase (AMP-forming)/AMP-acid ligase II
LQAITRYRATNSGGPNFAFDLCVRKTAPEERRSLDLSSWRVAYNGAEPIRWETLERFYMAFRDCGFRWRSFYPVYGLAEATLVVSSGRRAYEPRPVTLCADRLAVDKAVETVKSETPGYRITSCGPFSCGTRVVIARRDTGERCGPGEIGEIWIQSKSVAQGYWNRPEETRRTFHARLAGDGEGPFLRTGDLGFIDEGELIPTGRIKDLIIIRGRKHYPQDIERTVEECHEAILDGCVAAFGVDSEGEESLVVVAEVNRHRLRDFPNFDDVLVAVREMVVKQHEIPLHAVALLRPGSIPKTSSGKLKRYACRAGLLDGTLQPVARWVRTAGASPEGTC